VPAAQPPSLTSIAYKVQAAFSRKAGAAESLRTTLERPFFRGRRGILFPTGGTPILWAGDLLGVRWNGGTSGNGDLAAVSVEKNRRSNRVP